MSIFLPGPDGRRPVHGWYDLLATDPRWKDNMPFHEYFHGDTGMGLGAEHQTGWTALVAHLILTTHEPPCDHRKLIIAPTQTSSDRESLPQRNRHEQEHSMDLTGKVAIVTGGNSGIGKACVLELAAQGASIVIDYVSHPEATDELEKQLAALGEDQVIGVDADVSKVADLQNAGRHGRGTFGRLDIMVNNAGVETRTNVLDTTEAQYEFVHEREPEERVLRHPDRREADDRAGRRRVHHQHELGARGLADARQHRLLPVQGRRPDAHPHRRPGTRAARHPDRQRRPGRRGHPDQHRDHERSRQR